MDCHSNLGFQWRRLLCVCFAVGLLWGESASGGSLATRTRNEVGGGGHRGRRHCISYGDTVGIDSEMSSLNAEEVFTEMVCTKESQFCYALWIYSVNGTREWVKQGCWETGPETASCQSTKCVSIKTKGQKNEADTTTAVAGEVEEQQQQHQAQLQPQQKPPTSFCCCSSDNCNMDVEVVYVDPDPEEEDDSSEGADIMGTKSRLEGAGGHRIAIGLVVLCGCVIVAVSLAGACWKKFYRRRPRKDGEGGGDHTGDDEDGGMFRMSAEGKLRLLTGAGEGESLLGDEGNGGMVDGIQLIVLLARGKFASVYEGRIASLSDKPFALKCFGKEHKEFFENERFVFNFLGKHCNHENIIKYHGWQEFTVGPTTHLILVLDKICPGSLRDFLQSLTMSTEQERASAAAATAAQGQSENEKELQEQAVFKIADVLRICSGIASGLSYLHGENRDEIVIAHRDLTSKNILLDAETLTPKITDFGLSLVTRGSKYYWAGRERQAEFCSLAEAGTLRYMAPELLEGAVNLKDCENALKQADVYALALILWEVANCSQDVRLTQVAVTEPQQPSGGDAVTQAGDAPASTPQIQYLPVQHSLPYEDEIGKDNLSMDGLSRHVVQMRLRPHFRRWRDSPYTRQLRDTLVESWDAEPDARLTALCIVERLHDIRNIRLKNSDLSKGATHQSGPGQALQSPLESPTSGLFGADGCGPMIIDSPWTGRNPCLQRNLLANNTTTSTSGGTHSSEGLSTSGSMLSDTTGGGGLPAHPLLLSHFDLAKNQANLNFYHNYVGGSSGGTSYTGSSTGGGGPVTEVSNVSSVTDERGGAVSSSTRCPSTSVAATQNTAVGTGNTHHHPLPPTIPFLQNLHN